MFGEKKINLNKKTFIVFIIIILIFSIVIIISIKNNKIKPKEVSIDTVSKRKITETTTETGTIEPNYRSNILLNSSQKVLKVAVKEGDFVKKGDLLVLLDSSEYETELEKQKINLQNAQLTLNQMLNTGIDKDKSSSENSLIQAKANLETAKRKYDDLNKKFSQKQTLFNAGSISQSELDDAKKDKDDAQTALSVSESALSSADISLKDTLSNSDNKVSLQKNQIALIQKDIDNYQKKIDDSKIISNIDGKIIKIDAKENEFPKSGDEIIVDDVSQYKVSVDLKQFDTLKAAKDQKVNIKIKGSSQPYTGTISEIAQYAENKTNAGSGNQENKVKITVIIDNPTYEIKAGYEADVQFIFKEKEDSIAIGFDGIKENKTSGEKYVYFVNPDNKIFQRSIKTGIQGDYYVEITDGLELNDKYVLNPPENLMDGDLVSIGSSAKTAASN
ncbi:efflux RND transporter periplasmic adaptor subunit [Clostridium saccharoperbutylacetonicum]